MIRLLILNLCAILLAGLPGGEVELLNVSYDPTREFYEAFNKLFSAHWQKSGNAAISIKQSHGGSGKQTRSVIDGLQADVVSLALPYDVDSISRETKGKLLPENWRSRLPHDSAPYTSTIVFLVRAGNPKNLRDWGDLVRDGVEVITPDPKTSGGARYNYLAAWAWARANKGSDEKARAFVAEIYQKHVKKLDSGARGSTNTFVNNKLGDVLLAWENEAILAVEKLAPGKLEIVAPSVSILADPPVAWIDANVQRRGTQAVAEAYLRHLYSPEAQALAAKHFYRPRLPESADPKDLARFAKIEMITVEKAFGGWSKAHADHFADEAIFDQIMAAK